MVDAIVGAVIGAAIVLVGLFGSQVAWLRNERWSEIRRCATQINVSIGRVLLPMFIAEKRELAEQDSWAEANHALLEGLVELRVVARGPGKRLERVRYLAYALTYRLQAAEQIFRADLRVLGPGDLETLTGPNHALQRLVFGELDPAFPSDPQAVDAAVAYLVEHGLSADQGWYRPKR